MQRTAPRRVTLAAMTPTDPIAAPRRDATRPIRASVVVGTRPEAIKLAPVVRALAGRGDVAVRLVSTGQHRDMLRDVLELFGLVADVDLDVTGAPAAAAATAPAAALSRTCAAMLAGLADAFAAEPPDVVLVHGDTSTTLAGALAAFHARVPVAHVEAGLRTGDLAAPWPEEGNRKLVAAVAARHYAPTAGARDALLAEGVDPGRVLVTGNTVIDALLAAVARLEAEPGLAAAARAATGLPDGVGDGRDEGRRLVLVTGHRRESFGGGFERICAALARLAERGDVDVVYPVHLNPAVQGPVRRLLGGARRVHLIPPQGYLAFVALMRAAHLILTDSGGIQEEAPALGVPVLVMRETTERPEAVAAGTVRLVGTDPDAIVAEAARLLDDPGHHARMGRAANPYGDGTAAPAIAADVAARFGPAAGAASPFAPTPDAPAP